MYKSSLLKLTLLTSIIAISGCNQIRSSNNQLIQLTSTETEKLFTNYTVEAFNLSNGTTSFTYYAANGEASQERLWERRQGQWRINEKGQICLKFARGKERCRIIAREDGVYRKYRLEKGKMKALVRYRRFLAGNTLNL